MVCRECERKYHKRGVEERDDSDACQIVIECDEDDYDVN